MKNKSINLALVLSLALSFALFGGQTNVLADPEKIPNGSTVSGSENLVWVVTPSTAVVEEIPMVLVRPAAPADQQLMSNGVELSGPAKICYPFRGGQFGWHGQIRLLADAIWVPLATTVIWTPDAEGKLMACAKAPVAGTYALFAYWQPLP